MLFFQSIAMLMLFLHNLIVIIVVAFIIKIAKKNLKSRGKLTSVSIPGSGSELFKMQYLNIRIKKIFPVQCTFFWQEKDMF